ncbi:MAG: hypothetical protein SFY95_11845 [Planctomycetota bacterium]|nr:hypothetical protein [Planctomycetota bacterium]
MFPKLAFLVIVLGVFGSSLLAMRQSRLQAYSELAQTQLRIRQQDEHLLNVRSRIAQAVAPTNVQRLAANVGPLKPLVPERTFTPTYAGRIPTEAEPRIVPQPRTVRAEPTFAANTPAPAPGRGSARVEPASSKRPTARPDANQTPTTKAPAAKTPATKAPARTGSAKAPASRDRVAAGSSAKAPTKAPAKTAAQTRAAQPKGQTASAKPKSDPKPAQRPMQKVALGDARSPGAEPRP